MEGFELKQNSGKIPNREERKKLAKVMDFSKYFDSLDPPSRKRYCEKIKLIDNVDPDVLDEEEFTYDINCFPSVTYPDIINYLVFGPSPFSADDMKAYKSLDAYNQVLEGWVLEVKTLISTSVLILWEAKWGF